jgi:hypothetical protein
LLLPRFSYLPNGSLSLGRKWRTAAKKVSATSFCTKKVPETFFSPLVSLTCWRSSKQRILARHSSVYILFGSVVAAPAFLGHANRGQTAAGRLAPSDAGVARTSETIKMLDDLHKGTGALMRSNQRRNHFAGACILGIGLGLGFGPGEPIMARSRPYKNAWLRRTARPVRRGKASDSKRNKHWLVDSPGRCVPMGLTTEELVTAFLACTLPKEQWTHQAHMRVGLWHLWHHDAESALALLRERIRCYNVSCGGTNTDHSGYHETITRFYVCIIERFLLSADRSKGIDELAQELLAKYGDRSLPLQYYSREQLFSVLARRQWVEPDLEPLQ